MIRTVLISSVVILGLVGGAVAFADPAPDAAPTPGMPGMMGPGPGMMGHGPGMGPGMEAPGLLPFVGPHMICAAPEATLAGGIAFAEKRLGITDAQRAAWNKLAEALRAAEPALKSACDTMKAQREADKPAAAPERLATMQKMMSLGLEQLNRIQPALADLYAQLTPEQKTLIDQVGHHPRPEFGPGGPHEGKAKGHNHGWGWMQGQPQQSPAPQPTK